MEASKTKTQDIRLFAFDFDGTLVHYPNAPQSWSVTKASSWELIGASLGAEAERKEMHDAYHRGEFNYLTWAQKSVDNFMKHGLTKQMLDSIFHEQMELMPGAEELFRELRLRGIKSAIISGGIKNVYDIFAKKFGLGVDYIRMAHELKFDAEGKLVGATVSNLDYEGKISVLLDICSGMGISMKQCAYIGDGRNDIPLLKEVGLPVAINTTNEELIASAHVVIGKDISQLLRYI